jgi:acyl carrier protein
MNVILFDEIQKILVSQFGVDASAVRPDTTLEQLGLDSLTLMEFVFAVEDRFDLRVPEDRLDPRQSGITLERLADILGEQMLVRAPGSPEAA